MNFLKKIKRQASDETNISTDGEFEGFLVGEGGAPNDMVSPTTTQENILKIYESIEKINKKYKKPSGFISRTFSTISGNILLIGILGGTGYFLYNLQKKNKKSFLNKTFLNDNSKISDLQDEVKELKEKFLGKDDDEEDGGIIGKLDDLLADGGMLGDGEGSIMNKVDKITDEDNETSIVYKVNKLTDENNEDSIVYKVNKLTDETNEDSIVYKVNKLTDKTDKDSIVFKVNKLTDESDETSVVYKVNGITGKVGTIEKQVGTIEGQVGTIEEQVGTIEEQVGTIEGKVGTIEKTVGTIEGKVGTIEGKVGAIDGKVDTIVTNTTPP